MTEATANDNVIEAFTYKADGWVNFITGMGLAGRDKAAHGQFLPSRELLKSEIEDLYRGDSIARRIVDVLPGDMLREWWGVNVSGDEDDPIDPADANRIAAGVQSEMKRLRARKEIKRGLKWGRMYGGAVVLIGVDDGQDDPQEPVKIEAVKKVKWLKAVHRHLVTPGPNVTDVDSEFFGQPEHYRFHGFNGESEVNMLVHASRVMRFDGIEIPEDSKRTYLDRWNDSVFHGTQMAIADYQQGYRAASALIADFAQAVWAIPHLHELISENREDVIQRRISVQDFARSVVNAVLIDPDLGETFKREATPVAGLPDLLDRLSIHLSAHTGMPITKLLGTPPKGFASEDVTAKKNWADVVASEQEETLRSELEKLVHLIMVQSDGPIGTAPALWSIEFNPLEQQTETERAALRKTIAEADAIWIDREVVTPDEAAASHFTSDGFEIEITLDAEARELMAGTDEATPEDEATVEAMTAATAPAEGDAPAGVDTPPPEDAKPADAALNGSQIASLLNIVTAIEAGVIPRDAGIQIVARSFLMSVPDAEVLVASAGTTEPEPEPEPAPPPIPPASDVSPVSEPEPEGDDDAPEDDDDGAADDDDAAPDDSGDGDDDGAP